MDSRGVSRDGAVNRLLEDQIEIEIEGLQSPGNSQSPTYPRSPYHAHSRGPSESQNLLQSRPRGLSESQNLLSAASKNLFEYSSTRELTGYAFQRPTPPRSANSDGPIWAGVPQTLRRYRNEWLLLLVIDTLAFCTGLPFVALAAYLIWLNGKAVQDHQMYVLDQCIKGVRFPSEISSYMLTKKASTLLPLLFSFVVGRTMIKVASWKLERGTSLGLMEQLTRSQTVGGTLISIFKMRSWKLFSIVLLVLWLLSPVGSQAALRMLTTTPAAAPETQTLQLNHFNTRQASYAGFGLFDSWFSSFASIFSAAIFSPDAVKISNVDLWGNVKIPFFSSFSNATQDVNGWRSAFQNSAVSYSSLFGIPMSGLHVGNSTFSIESSYMELSCTDRTSNIAINNGTFFDPGFISENGTFLSAKSVTSSTDWIMGYLGDDLTSLLPNSSIQSIESLPFKVASQPFLPGILLYQDFTGTRNVTSIFCTPSQSYVESAIACVRESTSGPGSCVVTAQRLSLLPHMPTTITLFSFLDTFLGTSLQLPYSEPQVNHVDPIQNYIANPFSNSYIQSAIFASDTGEESRFQNISLHDFGTRLSQVMNTFLQGSMMNSSAFLTDPASAFLELPKSGASNTPTTLTAQIAAQLPALSIQANTTIPHLLPQPLLYEISFPWLALFLLASLVLPICAVISTILARRTVARDYLGSVSSLARESQYINFPNGGASLSGVGRSRDMRSLRVKLGDQGDVEGGFSVGTGVTVDVGVLALGEEGRTVSLDRRKLYL